MEMKCIIRKCVSKNAFSLLSYIYLSPHFFLWEVLIYSNRFVSFPHPNATTSESFPIFLYPSYDMSTLLRPRNY